MKSKPVTSKLREFALFSFVSCFILIAKIDAAEAEDCVVMLHGLASSPVIFKPLELVLDLQPELRVVNYGYNSYEASIEELANSVVSEAINDCNAQEEEQIHFVTHSMGGILLRTFIAKNELPHLGRVVMIAPPNKGSEVVDLLEKYNISGVLGPAGKALSTNIEEQFNEQQEPDIELGIIAGAREKSWILGRVIPEEDDGKVSVERTKLETMDDFIEIKSGHTALLMQKQTIEQTIQFLRYGHFLHEELNATLIQAEPN